MFVVFIGIRETALTDYVYSEKAYEETQSDPAYAAWIPLFGSAYAPLMGILGGGFYCHNMSLSIVANAKHPEHNNRNILAGFFLVFLTYSVIGVTGIYGFTGSNFEAFQPSVNMIQ